VEGTSTIIVTATIVILDAVEDTPRQFVQSRVLCPQAAHWGASSGN